MNNRTPLELAEYRYSFLNTQATKMVLSKTSKKEHHEALDAKISQAWEELDSLRRGTA